MCIIHRAFSSCDENDAGCDLLAILVYRWCSKTCCGVVIASALSSTVLVLLWIYVYRFIAGVNTVQSGHLCSLVKQDLLYLPSLVHQIARILSQSSVNILNFRCSCDCLRHMKMLYRIQLLSNSVLT